MKKTISIIIPIYNSASTLEECLFSACNQKFRDFDIIVVDCNSNDNSLTIIKKFQKQYKNVLYYNSIHKGPSAQRSYGILKSNSSYITCLDSDDMLHSQYLESLYNLAKDNNADYVRIACTRNKFQDHISETLNIYKLSNNKDPLMNIGKNFGFACWGTLIKQEIAKASCCYYNHIVTFSRYEDYIYTYFVLCRSSIAIVSNKILYFYRENPKGVSNSYSNTINDAKNMYNLYVILERIRFDFSYTRKMLTQFEFLISDSIYFLIKNLSNVAYKSFKKEMYHFYQQIDIKKVRTTKKKLYLYHLAVKYKLFFILFIVFKFKKF